MVDVPQARPTDRRDGRVHTQPVTGALIDRICPVVAHQGERIAFDVGPITLRAGFVVDVQPEEGEVADVLGHPTFESGLFEPDLTLGAAALAPLRIHIVEVVAFTHRLADPLAEDRPAMIAGACERAAVDAAVGSQPVPE